MFLKINGLLAISAIALPTGAIAQNQPVEPGKTQTAPGQMQTTPGQTQTAPGDASQNTPAVTGETPSGETTAKGQISAAGEADFKKGANVYDSTGALLGTIDSVSAKSATISTGKVRAAIPLTSFGKGETGLVLGMSKAELEAAAAAKTKK